MEVFTAIFLFIPVFDTTKRNVATMMSKQSFLPKLRTALYIVAAFLVFTLFASWKELGISDNGDANLLRKAVAKYDFILAFSTLVIGPLMWRYFAVMSKMKRLQKSNIALERQYSQSSKSVYTLTKENKELVQTNEKWRALNFKNEPSLSIYDGGLDFGEIEVAGNIMKLKRQQKILEEKNKALERELEETKKSVQNQKLASIEQARNTSKTYEQMQQELENYKMMLFKSSVSLGK